ncbi:hypothetical protein IAU60_003914 [Kwoniella sp. DSM 27419]
MSRIPVPNGGLHHQLPHSAYQAASDTHTPTPGSPSMSTHSPAADTRKKQSKRDERSFNLGAASPTG